MCGRFVASSSPAAIAAYFDVDEIDPDAADHTPNFNTAPTNGVLAVVEDRDIRTLSTLKWGLVPSWAKDPGIGSRLINARAETIAEKPSFRAAFARRRCIIPADGFYEWTDDPAGGRRQPYFIHSPDGSPYAFAGLWEQWHPPATAEIEPTLPGMAPGYRDGDDRPVLRSCVIVTTAANAAMAPLHDRMPVILRRDQWDPWLSTENQDKHMLSSFLVPAADDVVTFYKVSKDVNSTCSRGEHLLAPV